MEQAAVLLAAREPSCLGSLESATMRGPLFLAILLGGVGGLRADTLLVTNTGDNLAGSLRQAVQDANSGDTILFAIPKTDPGYNASSGVADIVLTSGELVIGKDLTVSGAGNRISIRRSTAPATPLERIFTVNSGVVTLDSLTIADGYANSLKGCDAGGVRNAGNLTLRNCTLTNNRSLCDAGGGVHNVGTLSVVDCTIVANFGGGIENEGILTVTASTITGNYNANYGGGIRSVSGSATVQNTVIAQNQGANPNLDLFGAFASGGYNFIGVIDGSSGFGGAGSHDQFGTRPNPADPKLGSLQDNRGPAFTRMPLSGSPLLDQGIAAGTGTDQRGFLRPNDNPSIANAVGGDGSDIGAVEIDVAQSTSAFVVNSTDERSDSVCGKADCTLLEAINAANANSGPSTIDFVPGLSGTIFNTLFPTGLEITSSVTIEGPGARTLTVSGKDTARVFNIAAGAQVIISGLTIANGNSVSVGTGGGIFNSGNLTLRECAVLNNKGGSGGGALNTGTLTIERSTFAGNESTGHGGAVRNTGVLHLINSTFSSNSAFASGAITSFVNSGTAAVVTVRNCTVSSNNSRDTSNGLGGGLYNGTLSTMTVGNSIIANNDAAFAYDVSGNFTSEGFNFIGNRVGSSGFESSTDHEGNPGLENMTKNNGGPTDTCALLPGSPAINAGNDALAPPKDQRGLARNGPSDIGAFEFAGLLPVSLSNISTRGVVGTGNDVLIAGLVVSGNSPKRVLIRAIGPTLGQPPFNVPTFLANPQLTLFDAASSPITTNDNWESAANAAEITASGFSPPNQLESAILTTLAPGNYTAVVAGVGNTTGVALVDVYDLDPTSTSKLANISTRGFVHTGDDVLIAGLVVRGPDQQNVIIRGLGPTLGQFGVANFLADPFLDLRDANGNVLLTNDNWTQTQQSQIQATGFAPPNAAEAAIVTTLVPGNYTAILSGVNNTTGNALVEVYGLN